MKVRLVILAVLSAVFTIPVGLGSTALACDPEHNYPCDPMPNDDFQYIYCKLSPTC